MARIALQVLTGSLVAAAALGAVLFVAAIPPEDNPADDPVLVYGR